MADTIHTAALASGFDLCGIAAAQPGPEDTRLKEWLDAGFHGDMAYMERRRAPDEIVPGCRSVIALATNYYTPDEHAAGPRVSRYAWGEDYHLVMKRQLDRLLPLLQQLHPAEQFRAYSDTGPLLEKAWAERAGIGWIGKNGCLITQEFGSWVFLATVLTTAALTPGASHADRCGTCTRCLSSCPTDAFVQPRVIDARRCIPYLTIEQWKPIARTLDLDEWAFGCDACQDVCPWNSRAKDSARQEFAPRPGQANPDLASWITMTKGEYRATYGDTALARPGRRGLARNALAVLGDATTDTLLEHAAADRSALVRDQGKLARDR